jgi:hypothetical protein
MRVKVLNKLALQEAFEDEIEDQVINNYIRFMKDFFSQRELIPDKNYVEIRYEDLVKNPLKQLRNIYDILGLENYENAETYFKKYIESKRDYKTNVYNIDKKIIEKVKNQWDFTIKMWNYKPPT